MRKTIGGIVLVLIISVGIPAHAQSGSWMRGTWEGTGYQTDTDSKWTMLLIAGSRRFRIQYPSLECSGEWQLISRTGNEARFRERLRVGTEQCTDNGKVILRRLSERQMLYLFSNPGSSKVIASAVLNKK